jgi:hypothetical protein
MCIEALLAEEAALPGISIKDVKRIWPVVIAAGHVWQTSGLWAYLDSARDPAKCKSFGSPRVRPVQLFDAPDFEMFLALAHHGSNPITLLKHKTENRFRHCDLAVWLANDPKAPDARVRLPALEAVFDEMATSVAGLFGVMHIPRGSSSPE